MIRTARALYPNRPEFTEPEFVYEPLPLPEEHPELALMFETGAADAKQAASAARAKAPDEPMQARMLNEFVYCPRLFYYEYVEGVFVENADTERGNAIHAKIDRGKGELRTEKKASEKPKKRKGGGAVEETLFTAAAARAGEGSGEAGMAAPEGDALLDDRNRVEVVPEGETIHSRSAMMSSERLRVVAKMDLVEVQMTPRASGDGWLQVASVTPVDYKAGAPREGAESNELWPTDKMQLGLQILILRDNGFSCNEGVIYYRATKQRVRLPMTAELETWILERIVAARAAAEGPLPPPLVGSPKCVRCSLAPVCLPDETRLLAQSGSGILSEGTSPPASSSRAEPSPRRLIAARDDARALYLNTPGLRVGHRDELLVVKEGDQVRQEVRAMDVTHVALFGNIQISTQAVQTLCELDIPVAYFSMGGWFYGLTRGHGLKNVFTRIQQFRAAEDDILCLSLARRFVSGKIRNHRTLLMRLHAEAPTAALLRLKHAALDALAARSLEELLGIEGAAAALYFQHFSGMVKVGSGQDDDDPDEIPGLEGADSSIATGEARAQEQAEFTFDFTKRTRRPPEDPVNALLSLAYSLLAKDCTIAVHAVGLDPYVGYYHQPRFGRPALALDLMEEFRPLVAESTVLTAINNRMISSGHFVRAGNAVNLTPAGRKVFFQAYEQRMNTLVTHPVFDYKASYRRVLELQVRILARFLAGEIPEYVPMVTR